MLGKKKPEFIIVNENIRYSADISRLIGHDKRIEIICNIEFRKCGNIRKNILNRQIRFDFGRNDLVDYSIERREKR